MKIKFTKRLLIFWSHPKKKGDTRLIVGIGRFCLPMAHPHQSMLVVSSCTAHHFFYGTPRKPSNERMSPERLNGWVRCISYWNVRPCLASPERTPCTENFGFNRRPYEPWVLGLSKPCFCDFSVGPATSYDLLFRQELPSERATSDGRPSQVEMKF